ncbi:hypothetical protein ACWELJ_25865 [Nocardia sp. NPDC004582]
MTEFDRATRCPKRYRRLVPRVFTAEGVRDLECRDYHDHVSAPGACVITDGVKAFAADYAWLEELRRIAALPDAERSGEIDAQRLHDVDIKKVVRFVDECQRAERRVRLIVDGAEELERRIEALVETLASAGANHGYDYAVHMADSTADPDTFEPEHDAHVTEMARNLTRVEQRLAWYERDHCDVLSAAGWFARQDRAHQPAS